MRAQQAIRRGRFGAGAVVVAALLVSTSSACAQTRLERFARELARSVPRTADATVSGTIAVRFAGVDVKGADSVAPPFPVANAKFVAQPGTRRHALVGDTGRAALADHRVLYARRALNGPADRRPWVRLEVDRLDEVDVPRLENLLNQQDTGVLAVISPRLVLDSLHGVLTGSVKQRRLGDGRRAFRFNVSLDKAERELELSEQERDDNELLYRSVALTGDIFGAAAALRADGSLEEVTLHLVERPDKRSAVRVDVVLQLDPPSTTAPALWPPQRSSTIRVSSLAALRASLVQQLGPKVPVERAPISVTLRNDAR